jgi:hypothetical protein
MKTVVAAILAGSLLAFAVLADPPGVKPPTGPSGSNPGVIPKPNPPGASPGVIPKPNPPGTSPGVIPKPNPPGASPGVTPGNTTLGTTKEKPEPRPAAIDKKFRDVEVEEPFSKHLYGNLLLMEATGAKLIRLPNGQRVIVSVASTVLKDGSATDRLRAEKVCKVKALASVAADKNVSELLQVTKTKVEEIARDMPVVGKWRSKDGEVFYLAIGVVCDKNGQPVKAK